MCFKRSQSTVSNRYFLKRLQFSFILIIQLTVATLFLSNTVFAQLSVDSIGTDTSQNEKYSCVRYSDHTFNTISITGEDNQESSLSIKQGKTRVKKSIKRSLKRRKRLKEKLKRLQKNLSSIRQKLIPRPGTGKKIKQLKNAIKRVRKAISIVNGQRKNLVNLRKQVIECGKKEKLTGGLVIRTVTWPSFLHNGEYTSYHIGVFYNLVRPVQIGESFCVALDNWPRVKKIAVTINPCPARFSDYSCAAQHFGIAGIAIGGVSGTDYYGENAPPGFCYPGDPDYKCDLAAAQAEAANIAAAANPTVLGKADSSRGCERFE